MWRCCTWSLPDWSMSLNFVPNLNRMCWLTQVWWPDCLWGCRSGYQTRLMHPSHQQPVTPHLTPTSLAFIAIIILIGAYLSLMDGRFKCGAWLCTRTFDTSGALLHHRPSCIHYQQQLTAQAKLRLEHKRFLYDTDTGSAFKKARQQQDNVGDPGISVLISISPSWLQNNKPMIDSDSASDPPVAVLQQSSIYPPSTSIQAINIAPGIVDSSSRHQATITVYVPTLSSESRSITEDHSSDPGLGCSGAPVWSRRLPAWFRDVLPELSLPSPPGLASI